LIIRTLFVGQLSLTVISRTNMNIREQTKKRIERKIKFVPTRL